MLRTIRNMGLGALLAYFFDPDNGRRRRAMARDRIPAFARGMGKNAQRTGGAVAAKAGGMKQKATHLKEKEKPQPDDVTLAHKVETEIFRDADVPKGQINVNAENGKIVLRGEVEKPELIEDLEKKTKKVQGVTEVENLLHTPGGTAPVK